MLPPSGKGENRGPNHLIAEKRKGLRRMGFIVDGCGFGRPRKGGEKKIKLAVFYDRSKGEKKGERGGGERKEANEPSKGEKEGGRL